MKQSISFNTNRLFFLFPLLIAIFNNSIFAQKTGILSGQITFDSTSSADRYFTTNISVYDFNKRYKPLFSQKTDTLGNFIFENLPVGLYYLEVRRARYKDISVAVKIKKGDTNHLKFHLISNLLYYNLCFAPVVQN